MNVDSRTEPGPVNFVKIGDDPLVHRLNADHIVVCKDLLPVTIGSDSVVTVKDISGHDLCPVCFPVVAGEAIKATVEACPNGVCFNCLSPVETGKRCTNCGGYDTPD